MASLVTALLQRVGTELQARPYSPEDEAIVHEELPEPMLEVRSAWVTEDLGFELRFARPLRITNTIMQSVDGRHAQADATQTFGALGC